MENAFYREMNLSRISYLEHVIILSGTNNINKGSLLDIVESLIEIGKYFNERSRNIKIVNSGIVPRNQCWSLNRIILIKVNDS